MENIKKEYKIKNRSITEYNVIEIVTLYKTNVTSNSIVDKQVESEVYHGNLCECYSYIKLKEGNYM